MLMVFGCISSMLRMDPSAAMKAMLKGIGVFFIQKLSISAFAKINSMPQSAHNDLRYIRPSRRVCRVSAISASILYLPIASEIFSPHADCREIKQNSKIEKINLI